MLRNKCRVKCRDTQSRRISQNIMDGVVEANAETIGQLAEAYAKEAENTQDIVQQGSLTRKDTLQLLTPAQQRSLTALNVLAETGGVHIETRNGLKTETGETIGAYLANDNTLQVSMTRPETGVKFASMYGVYSQNAENQSLWQALTDTQGQPADVTIRAMMNLLSDSKALSEALSTHTEARQALSQAIEALKTQQQTLRTRAEEAMRNGFIQQARELNWAREIAEGEQQSVKDAISIRRTDSEHDVTKVQERGMGEEKTDDTARETEEFEALKTEYFDDLKNRSEYPETINISVKSREWTRLSPKDTAKMRKQFGGQKKSIIQQWEKNNNMPWPTYSETVYSHRGKVMREKGNKYDAHHIQPLSMNGQNAAENITPMHCLEHYDRRGVHRVDAPYGKLEK